MAFKDVKQNYSVYILNKQDITITDGKIEESISRMESTVNNFINSFNNAKGNSNTAQ